MKRKEKDVKSNKVKRNSKRGKAKQTSFPDVMCDEMKTESETKTETTVAARIAGEDVACGDYVAVMTKLVEVPSWPWQCSGVSLQPDELVRLRMMPEEAGQPYKVIGVCLPFVYAKSHCGTVVILDTRQKQLVRLDRDCARLVWKELKSPSGRIGL